MVKIIIIIIKNYLINLQNKILESKNFINKIDTKIN